MDSSILIVCSVIAVFCILAILPVTRPYLIKYWWLVVLVGIAAVAVALRRKMKFGTPVSYDGGRELESTTVSIIDKIADDAEEGILKANYELKAKKQGSKAEAESAKAKIEALNTVADSMERRRALVKMIEELK